MRVFRREASTALAPFKKLGDVETGEKEERDNPQDNDQQNQTRDGALLGHAAGADASRFLAAGFFLDSGRCHPNPRRYFLNKLSKAARASVGLRGAAVAPLSPNLGTAPEGCASRATVTRGTNSSQVLA